MHDADEDFSMLLKFPADYPLADLYALSERLAGTEVCVPGYLPPPVGLFHPDGFFYDQHIERSKTILIPDRNVVSRMAQLARWAPCGGRSAGPNGCRPSRVCAVPRHRDRPIGGIPRPAHTAGNEAAWEELGWFRSADNARVHDVMDVALGRGDQLRAPGLPHEVQKHDLAKPLRRWNRNYIIALKVMDLEMQDLRPIERVLRLLDWMRDDFMFGGPAAMLASVYFAPNSPPRRRVFKDKNSSDREAAIAGARNAAWDLTHLSEFVRKVNEAGPDGRPRYLFASFDRHLRLMAKLLFDCATEISAADALPKALSSWWSKTDARRIAATIAGHLDRINSAEWRAKTAPVPDFINHMIARGEAIVREAAVKPRG
tara:strand:+ start:8910 stop:10025 length:1116 start_codon:yes stop_codon:yes gene_type:complete